MTINLSVILLAMPIAPNTAAMAERYGGDYVFASACVSVSTLLSVVTVPLITWLIQML
jgi:predicted permease